MTVREIVKRRPSGAEARVFGAASGTAESRALPATIYEVAMEILDKRSEKFPASNKKGRHRWRP